MKIGNVNTFILATALTGCFGGDPFQRNTRKYEDVSGKIDGRFGKNINCNLDEIKLNEINLIKLIYLRS